MIHFDDSNNMLGFLTSDFGYQHRIKLLQHLIDCGDVLLGQPYTYGMCVYL